MAYEGVVISQIDELPDFDHSPSKTTFIALGCIVCTNKVCLRADGVDMINLVTNPATPATVGLDEAIQNIDHYRIIDSFGNTGWDTACEVPCGEAKEIREAVISINRRFGKSLNIPKGV